MRTLPGALGAPAVVVAHTQGSTASQLPARVRETMRSVAAFTLQRCLAQWNRAWESTAMVCTRTTSSSNRTRANHVQVCEKHARTEARFYLRVYPSSETARNLFTFYWASLRPAVSVTIVTAHSRKPRARTLSDRDDSNLFPGKQ